jgi:hypothetical protein
MTFSTATWTGTGCGSGPTADDSIILDITSLGANTTLNNDTAASLTAVTQTGTNSSGYGFTISGQDLAVKGTIDGGTHATLVFDTNLTIASDTAVGGYVTFNTAKTVTLAANLTVSSGAGLTVDSVLAGTGNLIANSTAAVYLNKANTWTGAISIGSDAVARVSDASAFGSAANVVTVSDGGVIATCGLNGATIPQPLNLTGYSGSGGQAGYGTVQANSACGMGGAPTSSDPHANVTFSGDVTLNSDLKVGSAGVLTFNGSTATGAHTISILDGQAGSLVLAFGTNGTSTANGTHNSATLVSTYSANSPGTSIFVSYNEVATVSGTYGDTTVNGGTLKGSGTVGVLTLNSGTVAPGNSPGVLNTGNLTFTGGSLEEEVGGTAAGQYDQLNVTGTVDLGSATTLNVSQWNNFVPANGDMFTIVKNDGSDAVTGTFQGLAEGATVTSTNGVSYTISYKGGDGNDVVLTAVATTNAAAPDTGFEHLANNPLATLIGTFAIVAIISLIARKQLKANK